MWLQHNLTVACVVFLNRVHGGAKRAIVERTFLVRVSIQRVTPIILRYTALHSAYYAYIYCIALRARGVTHSRGTRVRATNRAPPPVTIICSMDRSESLRFEGIPLLQTGGPRDRASFDTVISRFSIVRLLFAYRARCPLVNIEFDFIAPYGSRKRIFNGPYIYLCR